MEAAGIDAARSMEPGGGAGGFPGSWWPKPGQALVPPVAPAAPPPPPPTPCLGAGGAEAALEGAGTAISPASPPRRCCPALPGRGSWTRCPERGAAHELGDPLLNRSRVRAHEGQDSTRGRGGVASGPGSAHTHSPAYPAHAPGHYRSAREAAWHARFTGAHTHIHPHPHICAHAHPMKPRGGVCGAPHPSSAARCWQQQAQFGGTPASLWQQRTPAAAGPRAVPGTIPPPNASESPPRSDPPGPVAPR